METSSIFKLLSVLQDKGIVGALSSIASFTDEPKFPQWCCTGKQGSNFDGAGGVSMALSDKHSQIKAIAEAVERHCLLTQSNENMISGMSYISLESSAVDPRKFISFELPKAGKTSHFYSHGILQAPLKWVEGTEYKTGRKILLPAQVVYANYDLSEEPLIRFPISTGAAFGTNEVSAKSRGLLEVIERDRFMITWLKEETPREIKLEGKVFSEIKRYFERYLLEPRVFDISGDYPSYSTMSILIDRMAGVGPAISVGLKSAAIERESIIGSLLEAQQVRNWMRFCHIKDTLNKVERPEKIVDFKSRCSFWYDVEKIPKIDFITNTRKNKKLSNEKKDISCLPDNLISQGYDIYYADITLPYIKERGFHVIKTIVPQMHPLTYDENFPYLNSLSLKMKGGRAVNKVPHPFL
jgi:ribosomal protein S12 methylthiotransferase accessory factor